MKSILAAALGVALSGAAQAAPHPFDVHDLVMMERVSDPQLSPDGKTVAFSVRQTDYDANKGRNGIWTVPVAGGEPQRVTDKALNASGARWSHDGANLYFLAPKDGTNQLWRIGAKGGDAVQASALSLDVGSYKLSPTASTCSFRSTFSPTAPATPTCSLAPRNNSMRARPTRPAARSITRSSCAIGTPGPTVAARSCSSPTSARTARSAR
jgi:dipeptidyl aminopeptidase/acylaminoacyl peptidase